MSEKKSRKITPSVALLAAAGLCFVAVGLAIAQSRRDFMLHGEAVVAKVVSVETIRHEDNEGMVTTSYLPTFSYRVGSQDYRSKARWDMQTKPQVGADMTVLYLPDDPKQVCVDDVLNLYIMPFVVVGMAVCFLGVACFVYL